MADVPVPSIATATPDGDDTVLGVKDGIVKRFTLDNVGAGINFSAVNATTNMVFNTNGTEKMRLDSSGNLGIGQAGPADKLEVNGNTRLTWGSDRKFWMEFSNDYRVGMRLDDTSRSATIFSAGNVGDGGYIAFNTRAGTGSGTTDYGTERMRITSAGDVGVGTSSPSTYSAKLVTAGAFGSSTPAVSLVNTSAENAGNIAETQYWLANSFSGLVNVAKIGAVTGTTGNQYGSLYFSTSNAGAPTERMRLDAAGNLGLGVTPSAYELYGGNLYLYGALITSAVSGALTTNYNASANNKYLSNGLASQYYQLNGAHVWRTAPSGTAGDAVSFTQAMTLDASGNLGIGTSSPQQKFVISNGGALGFEFIPASGVFQLYNRSTSEYDYIIYDALGHIFRNETTERMRLDTSGNLIQTVNTTAATLGTNNTLTFSIVDNSTLRISVRGSDGTTRTATVALT